jgi:hypothetical protein
MSTCVDIQRVAPSVKPACAGFVVAGPQARIHLPAILSLTGRRIAAGSQVIVEEERMAAIRIDDNLRRAGDAL